MTSSRGNIQDKIAKIAERDSVFPVVRRTKRRKVIAVALLICFVVGIFAVYWPKSSTSAGVHCPIQSDTTIVVYGGSLTTNATSAQDWEVGGVDPLSFGWITNFLDWWHIYDSAVRPAFLNSTNLTSDCNLSNYPNVVLYIQPGGDAYDQQSALGLAGKMNILTFLDKGGAYVGICAGWYYAAKDYYWEGQYYNWTYLLGLVPTVEGSISTIADYPAYNMTRMSNGLNMIYYGGPTWGWRQTPKETVGTALMTFASIPGNLPAAVKLDKMLLLSVHPEAFEDYGIYGLSRDARIANYKWLANAIDSLIGGQFTVPQATSISVFRSPQQIFRLGSSLREERADLVYFNGSPNLARSHYQTQEKPTAFEV
jgi:hypothetical protein